MEKIREIEIVNRCYLDDADPEYFNATVICNGEKVEGIITEGDKEYLFFGAISEDRFFLVQGLTDDIGYATAYKGIKEGNIYIGTQFAMNDFIKIGLKESTIKVGGEKEISKEDLKELKQKIKEKSKNLNESSRQLYKEKYKKEESKVLLYSKK